MKSATFLYSFCRGLSEIIFRLYCRLDVYHRDRIPEDGPLIVCANHRSYADPPLVGVTMTRPVHFLAKEELFRFKPFGWLISNLNAHPLSRSGGDVGAFKAAIRVLSQNGVIIIFPEGGRSLTDEFRPAKPGVGLLVKKSKARVLPMYIDNSAHWLKAKKLKVMVGTPLSFEQVTDLKSVGQAVIEEIKKLKIELESLKNC